MMMMMHPEDDNSRQSFSITVFRNCVLNMQICHYMVNIFRTGESQVHNSCFVVVFSQRGCFYHSIHNKKTVNRHFYHVFMS